MSNQQIPKGCTMQAAGCGIIIAGVMLTVVFILLAILGVVAGGL